MNQASRVVQSLAATSSRTEKEQIIFDAFMRGEREFFQGAQLALSAYITFGVKKVALIEDEEDGQGSLTFNDFLALAERLRKRELTGHAARDAIMAAAERSKVSDWNDFYRRVLLKDLNCGVTESTINKVLGKLADAHPEAKDLMVPVFDCQLAHDGEKPEHQKKIKGRKLLDVKLDGMRLLTIIDKEQRTVTQHTRNGLVNENFVAIREALEGIMDRLPGSLVLDGEVIGKSFQDLMTQVQRKDKVDTSNARLALFDIIPLADFRAGVCKMTQEQRHAALSAMAPLLGETGGLVYVIPKVSMDLDTQEGQASYAEFNRQALAAKYEGIMVKDPKAPYECKRTASWLKVKPFIEVSLTVVGFERGKPDGKYANTLGALVCEGEDDGLKIRTNVSGMPDALRDEIWNNQARYLGMIAEVRADGLTLEQGETVYSMRFPRFKFWRGTKPGEKL